MHHTYILHFRFVFFLYHASATVCGALTYHTFVPGFFLAQYKSKEKTPPHTTLIYLAGATISLVWVYLSGTGGFVFQNSDWVKHTAILRDLVVMEWPVQYNATFTTSVTFLNYYLGMYMVPALIGKLFGMQVALAVQFLWIFCGVALSAAWLVRLVKKPSVLVFIFFILFATADSVGLTMVRNFTLFNFITPLERWSATNHEYSSFTTLLFWVPGQAVGTWIVTAAFIELYKNRASHISMALMALLLFWSPLGFIGLMPFAFFAIKKHRHLLLHLACAFAVIAFFYVYYSANLFGQLYGKNYMGLWVADAKIFWLRLSIFIFSEAFYSNCCNFNCKKKPRRIFKKAILCC
ncbi:MAG: hypothetical protein UZ22_OP11002000143 [Microgenomates bacterium OLB23]|nr:MAG: hypothetical protein UZ22_OP11002000143 [Microgenomates bacterium OLB23]